MPPRPLYLLVTVIGAIVVASVLGACSVSVTADRLDTVKLQNEITSGIEQQAGVAVSAVTCPENVEVRKGTTFDCTAVTADGLSLTVQVDVVDDDGNVEWQLVD